MTAMRGPGIFLAQFASDAAPFNSLPAITKWAAGLGYKGVQIPTWDRRLFDLDLCAESQTYADEVVGVCFEAGVEITELSTHLQGQLVAVNPAYDAAFEAFAPEAVKGNRQARQDWAVAQVISAGRAARKLGLSGTVSFTGSLAFPLPLPMATATSRFDRRSICRACPPLDADLECLRRGRRRYRF